MKNHKQDPEKMREEVVGCGGNSDKKAVWVILEGHGWDGKATKDGKTREGCGDGRLWEEKKAPTRAQSKKVKKHKEND